MAMTTKQKFYLMLSWNHLMIVTWYMQFMIDFSFCMTESWHLKNHLFLGFE